MVADNSIAGSLTKYENSSGHCVESIIVTVYVPNDKFVAFCVC